MQEMVWVQIIMQMMCSQILRKSRENESFFDHCEDADGTEKADGSRGQMVQEGRWYGSFEFVEAFQLKNACDDDII